jgi:hypothetical protein
LPVKLIDILYQLLVDLSGVASGLGRERPLGRPRHRWMDNFFLGEIRWDDVDWIDMAQDRDQWRALVNTVINLRVP